MSNRQTHTWGYFYRTGGRLAEGPAEEMTAMRDETIPLKGIHAFDKAHVVMLLEQGILPEEDGKTILRAFREMEKEGYEAARLRVGGGGHSGEAYLIEKLGMQVGGQLHLGRSSSDLIGVTVRIEERDRVLDVLEGITALNAALLTLAEGHLGSILPHYTHLQPAQPTTLAHYLVSWVYELNRDFDRFCEAYRRVNASPAGAAIGTGSPFAINRARTADLLGFDSVLQNTRDAIFAYDHHLELFSDLAILDNGLARFCSDLYVWSSFEVDMVELKDRFCGTSSINAAKKNAQALEQVLSLAASATGGLMTAFSLDRLPSDGWEVQWRTWSQQLWPVLRQTIRALRLLEVVVETMEIKVDRMAELVGSGWLISSDLAAMIVKERGVPWRTAHQVVARLVRDCIARGIGRGEVSSALVDEVSEQVMGARLDLAQPILDGACNPMACIQERRLVGGPAPDEVSRQTRECLMQSSTQGHLVAAMRDSLTRAEERLEHAITSALENDNGR